MFPSLLKKLWEKIKVNSTANLKAGFKKTGIFPTNATAVLERLPSFRHTQEPVDPDLISEMFIQYLHDKRKEVVDQSKGKGRKNRLNVVAAKSVSAEELQQVSLPSTSKEKNVPSASKGRNLPSTSEDRKDNPKKRKLNRK